MSHFIRYYACGVHVESQCRCPSTSKRREVSSTLCQACSRSSSSSDATARPAPKSDGWVEREVQHFIMRTAKMDFDWRKELVAFAREVERRAVERAAGWHDARAERFQSVGDTPDTSVVLRDRYRSYAENHREYAAAIRAMAPEVEGRRG